jgi:hypothetical protein
MMTRDEIVLVSLLAAFATLVTAHLALVAGLASRPPRWRAVLALPVAPLAPYWGARAGMHARVVVWIASAIAYAILRAFAK